jgi:hypothetical protein
LHFRAEEVDTLNIGGRAGNRPMHPSGHGNDLVAEVDEGNNFCDQADGRDGFHDGLKPCGVWDNAGLRCGESVAEQLGNSDVKRKVSGLS